MRLLISPWSRPLRNGKPNPKNYPFWGELVNALHQCDVETLQIGLTGEPLIGCNNNKFDLHMNDLKILLDQFDSWVSVDNFFPHFAHYYKKSGTVIFGKSDPNIFGYPENLNILKSRDYLRKDQFAFWENEEHSVDSFPGVRETFFAIKNKLDLTDIMCFRF